MFIRLKANLILFLFAYYSTTGHQKLDSSGCALPKMPVEKLMLVVHHEREGCKLYAASAQPLLMDKMTKNPKAALITIRGGQNTGDPFKAKAYHGFNGI